MRNKVLSGIGAITAYFLPMIAGAQMGTSSLATSINSVNATAYDYVAVLLTNYWPFVLGFLILLGVIAFGKRIVVSLFHG